MTDSDSTDQNGVPIANRLGQVDLGILRNTYENLVRRTDATDERTAALLSESRETELALRRSNDRAGARFRSGNGGHPAASAAPHVSKGQGEPGDSSLALALDRLRLSMDEQRGQLRELRTAVSAISLASEEIARASTLGFLSLYPTRWEAIDAFYGYMHEETVGISVVGSTLFGLRGSHVANSDDIMRLLAEKSQAPGFQLRILLTHWDFISQRQEQEHFGKNVARYVISKELMQATQVLKKRRLEPYVKFYKGAPTCFTLVCEGQGVMLVNPYPYEREAYKSWTILLREVEGGVYETFKTAHVREPWENGELAVPMSEDSEAGITHRREDDLREAEEYLKKELSDERSELENVRQLLKNRQMTGES